MSLRLHISSQQFWIGIHQKLDCLKSSKPVCMVEWLMLVSVQDGFAFTHMAMGELKARRAWWMLPASFVQKRLAVALRFGLVQ